MLLRLSFPRDVPLLICVLKQSNLELIIKALCVILQTGDFLSVFIHAQGWQNCTYCCSVRIKKNELLVAEVIISGSQVKHLGRIVHYYWAWSQLEITFCCLLIICQMLVHSFDKEFVPLHEKESVYLCMCTCRPQVTCVVVHVLRT